MEGKQYSSPRATAGALYAGWFHRLAAGLRRISGRGIAGSFFFAMLAAVFFFVSNLPIAQLSTSRSQYEQIRQESAAFATVKEMPATACIFDHATRAIEIRTKRPLFNVPDDFDPFANVTDSEEMAKQIQSVMPSFSVPLYVSELMDGRKLTEDVRDLPANIRTVPNAAGHLDNAGGKIPESLSGFVLKDAQNAAIADDIRAYCLDEGKAPGPGFTPIRARADYDRIVANLARNTLKVLDDPKVRETYNLIQKRRAQAQFFSSAGYAIGYGFLMLIAMKMAILICLAVRPRFWLVVNLVMTSTVIPAILIMSAFYAGYMSVARMTLPLATIFVTTSTSMAADEADYRRRLDYLIDHGHSYWRATCSDIGEVSPARGWCKMGEGYFRHWDPTSRRYDYDSIIRNPGGEKAIPASWMRVIRDHIVTIAVLSERTDKEERVRLDFWGGTETSLPMLIILSPLLFVLAAGAAMFVLLAMREVAIPR